jgi:M6 family metalloprotease-like protein
MPISSGTKWTVTTFIAVLAALIPLLIYYFQKPSKPIFVIANPVIRFNESIEILSVNKKAKKNMPLNVEFDGINFLGAGKFIGKEQGWAFKLIEQEYTHSMIETGNHEIRVGFSAGQFSDVLKVAFVNKELQEDTSASASSSSFLDSEPVLPNLLKGRRITEGKVIGLTVVVQFQDIKAKFHKERLDALLNRSGHEESGNLYSVREYFITQSKGKLDFTNDIIGPITLSKNMDYYKNVSFVEEALNILTNLTGVNLGNYDFKGENIVDSITFLYAGRTVYESWLWPHTFTVAYEKEGVHIQYYSMSSLGADDTDFSIGTFCRHTGFSLLRLPDLSKYCNNIKLSSSDSKDVCGGLMSSGSFRDGGKNPAPISPYLKEAIGW